MSHGWRIHIASKRHHLSPLPCRVSPRCRIVCHTVCLGATGWATSVSPPGSLQRPVGSDGKAKRSGVGCAAEAWNVPSWHIEATSVSLCLFHRVDIEGDTSCRSQRHSMSAVRDAKCRLGAFRCPTERHPVGREATDGGPRSDRCWHGRRQGSALMGHRTGKQGDTAHVEARSPHAGHPAVAASGWVRGPRFADSTWVRSGTRELTVRRSPHWMDADAKARCGGCRDPGCCGRWRRRRSRVRRRHGRYGLRPTRGRRQLASSYAGDRAGARRGRRHELERRGRWPSVIGRLRR